MVLSEKVDKNVRLDRRSCAAYRGTEKKNGHGQYGWGDINDEIQAGEEEFYEEQEDIKK
ncbi:hypothetical protein RB653_003751 [Dictyostelium firmibasis]|uniref:Hyaluronan/mRNA-binding protein domain-containing protein n=1 Tax=Dictyostelium firmibasis TaxID=79012 RepID=A0AAN7UI11_9MYCE